MRNFENPHYYEILEVSETASHKEISAAFRHLAKEYHPDRIPSHLSRLKREAQEKLKQINEAYQVLSDPEKRSLYDTYLAGLREEETEEVNKESKYDYQESDTEEEERTTTQETTKVIITCPNCHQKLRVPEGQVLLIGCPSCGRSFYYPFTESYGRKDFITIGSSKEEVEEVLGKPDSMKRILIPFLEQEWWYYGYSYVRFKDEKVCGYHQSPFGKDLKIKETPGAEEKPRTTERSWDEQFQYQNQKSSSGVKEESAKTTPPTSGDVPKVGIWLRYFAYVVDFSILTCGIEALLWYVYISIYANVMVFLGYLLFLPLCSIYFMYLQSHGRQTVGEKFLGIKVFPLSEGVVNKKRAFLRYLCCLIPFYGFATIPSLLNSRRSIADAIIKTQVLQVKKVPRVRFLLPIGILVLGGLLESKARHEDYKQTTHSQVPISAQLPNYAEKLPAPHQETTTGILSTQDIASMYWNSVVSISTYDSYLQNIGQGSGFVISADGVIVTNNHVVKPGQTPLIFFPNKTYYYASVLKRDILNDIAILKTNAGSLPTIPLGDSDKISVGDKIVVIGSPLGLQNTVSEGIVSAVRVSEDKKIKILQISAPISPGSSGSPVINTLGQCIGIATMYVEKGQNLNFAVSIEYVTSLLDISELSERTVLEKLDKYLPLPREEVFKDRPSDDVGEANKKGKGTSETVESKPPKPTPVLDPNKLYATKHSRVFHRMYCKNLDTNQELISFESIEEAIKSRGIPCNICFVIKFP